MAKKRIRPKLFENRGAPNLHMKSLAETLEQKTLDEGMKTIHKEQPDDVTAKRMPKYLEVTQERMEKQGVIDLKPYFARSSNAKRKEGGGWSLTIPIPRKSKSMSRRMYEDVRSVEVGDSGQKTFVTDYLYDKRRESDATELNYTPKSNKITKEKQGETRHTYVSYRTVSDKSPANSWIINRSNIRKGKSSDTMIKNVDRLMRWKMKNGWK